MPSASTKSRPARYEDLLRLPENAVGEIVDGDFIVSPRRLQPLLDSTNAPCSVRQEEFAGKIAGAPVEE
jgi:hypothetical protein